MTAIRHRQRGEGRAPFLITLALFLAGVFLAIKVVPLQIDGYQFREVLRKEARNAAAHRGDDRLVQRILDQAKAMDIPLVQENLKVSRNTVEVAITASYEKSVDLKFMIYTYKFDERKTAPVF